MICVDCWSPIEPGEQGRSIQHRERGTAFLCGVCTESLYRRRIRIETEINEAFANNARFGDAMDSLSLVFSSWAM